MGLGPFDLTGGPFLALYAALFAITLAVSIAIPRWLRLEGRRAFGVTDSDRLAYLTGGATRFAEALVARLYSVGTIGIEKKTGFLMRSPSAGQTSAERSVLALPSPAKWGDVARAVRQDAEAIEDKLVGQGLLIDRATAWQLRVWQTLPFLPLLIFGLTKWEIGSQRQKPVEFLTVFLAVTLVVAMVRFASVDRRTKGGILVLEDAKLQSARLRKGPVREEAALAVALFGTGVLAGSALSDLHALRNSSGGGDSGGSSDGGCGGGGCGGCGG